MNTYTNWNSFLNETDNSIFDQLSNLKIVIISYSGLKQYIIQNICIYLIIAID